MLVWRGPIRCVSMQSSHASVQRQRVLRPMAFCQWLASESVLETPSPFYEGSKQRCSCSDRCLITVQNMDPVSSAAPEHDPT